MSEDRQVYKTEVQVGQVSSNFIPPNLRSDLSGNSNAIDCFTLQTFSKSLQEFMLNYRTFVTSDYSVTDE